MARKMKLLSCFYNRTTTYKVTTTQCGLGWGMKGESDRPPPSPTEPTNGKRSGVRTDLRRVERTTRGAVVELVSADKMAHDTQI